MLHPYAGTPDRPLPPAQGAGWRDVGYSDRHARARAAGLLGEVPVWNFVDELGPSGGLYRFFAFETPAGKAVSALYLDGGTLGDPPPAMLGATNPSFVAPTAAQVAATPPGDTLANAANDLLISISKNGVPNEHVFDQATDTFQTAWNADPISQLNGSDGQLDEDGGYGPNVTAALASIAGGTAPAVNPAPAPTPGTTPAAGQTTHEPVPQPDATCAAWTADATNAQALAIANNLSFHDSPVAWADQGLYSTTIAGVPYRFVMWWENGLKAVAAYKCSSTTGVTTASVAGSSAVPAVITAVVVIGGLVATGFAARKPLGLAHHR